MFQVPDRIVGLPGISGMFCFRYRSAPCKIPSSCRRTLPFGGPKKKGGCCGIIEFPIFCWWIKQCKYMVNLRDFPQNNAWFGVGIVMSKWGPRMTILYRKSGAHDEPARGLSTSQTNKQTKSWEGKLELGGDFKDFVFSLLLGKMILID